MKMLIASDPREKKLLDLLKAYEYDYKSISKKLNVSRLQRTDYLQVEYVSEDPSLSAYVVNTVYDEFLRYYGTSRNIRSAESIDTLKSILEKKETGFGSKKCSTGSGRASQYRVAKHGRPSDFVQYRGDVDRRKNKIK